MLEAAEHLAERGFSLHWLRHRSKAPFVDAWTSEPFYTAADLRASYRPGYNVGVRTGEPSRVGDHYLYLIDLDIRYPALAGEAHGRLKALLPAYAALPCVASGSGGESRHFYFLCDGLFRSKKLAHSAEKMQGADGRWHWRWEIELFGGGKQAAIPPSIHPDTGLPYRWEREFDFDLVDMGLGPIVAAETVTSWHADLDRSSAPDIDEDDLLGIVRTLPMDLTTAQIDDTLKALPLPAWCEDREGWLTVGMALHHQFEGSIEGLNRWNTFSRQSPKFDPKDQGRVWKSFATKASGVRFATLIKAAADARLQASLAELGDDDMLGGSDDDDDLLGDLETAARPSVEWAARLDRNEEGALKPTLHNMEIIVRNDPRTIGVPRLNEFTQEVVQRATPGAKNMSRPSPKGTRQLAGPVWQVRDPVNGDLWSNVKDVAIRTVIEAPTRQGGYGIKVSDRDLRGAIDIAARENAFHPVREYLTGTEWDEVKRAETLFIDYLGAPDTPYSRSVARMFLIAAVTRVFEPGHKFDFAVILEGLQGKRKSTFIKYLAVSWFSELDGDFHDTKAMVESMQGSWILEIPELSGFGRSDVRQIKAFISRTTDKVRLAYEHRAALYPRQCVFIGSTNDDQYLRDDTGGRRFWPVKCLTDLIDTDRLKREVSQIWAEAHAMYREMRAAQPHGELGLYLTDDKAQAEALALQESRRLETGDDAMAGAIAEWLDKPVAPDDAFDGYEREPSRKEVTCLIQLWEECFDRDAASYSSNAQNAQTLARAMKKVDGWTQAGQHRFQKYGKQRLYTRET